MDTENYTAGLSQAPQLKNSESGERIVSHIMDKCNSESNQIPHVQHTNDRLSSVPFSMFNTTDNDVSRDIEEVCMIHPANNNDYHCEQENTCESITAHRSTHEWVYC